MSDDNRTDKDQHQQQSSCYNWRRTALFEAAISSPFVCESRTWGYFQNSQTPPWRWIPSRRMNPQGSCAWDSALTRGGHAIPRGNAQYPTNVQEITGDKLTTLAFEARSDRSIEQTMHRTGTPVDGRFPGVVVRWAIDSVFNKEKQMEKLSLHIMNELRKKINRKKELCVTRQSMSKDGDAVDSCVENNKWWFTRPTVSTEQEI